MRRPTLACRSYSSRSSPLGRSSRSLLARPPLARRRLGTRRRSRARGRLGGRAWPRPRGCSSTTGACLVALGSTRPALARRLAPALPLGVRRLVELAIVALVRRAPGPARDAAPCPPAPAVVADQPVVRRRRADPGTVAAIPAPGRRPVATTPLRPPRQPHRPTRPHRARPDRPQRARSPTPRRPPPERPGRGRYRVGGAHVVVRNGDNLWVIARAALDESSATRPTERRRRSRYWHAVDRREPATLRSGNPSLIYPGRDRHPAAPTGAVS